MKPFKQIMITVVAAVACAGVYSALRNLPAASGCGVYGDCPETADVEEPGPSPLAIDVLETATL